MWKQCKVSPCDVLVIEPKVVLHQLHLTGSTGALLSMSVSLCVKCQFVSMWIWTWLPLKTENLHLPLQCTTAPVNVGHSLCVIQPYALLFPFIPFTCSTLHASFPLSNRWLLQYTCLIYIHFSYKKLCPSPDASVCFPQNPTLVHFFLSRTICLHSPLCISPPPFLFPQPILGAMNGCRGNNILQWSSGTLVGVMVTDGK